MRVKRGSERGSVLMLMPAGVLIVVALGAIAFDLGLVRLAQREAHHAAAAAANDAATYGLDERALRHHGVYRLDRARAEAAAARALEGRRDAHPDVSVHVRLLDPETVEVTVVAWVPYVFGRALPGPDGTTVQARATAAVVRR